jgi:hypothetical protein
MKLATMSSNWLTAENAHASPGCPDDQIPAISSNCGTTSNG